jgi:uncharacterized protein (DUF4415 family)
MSFEHVGMSQQLAVAMPAEQMESNVTLPQRRRLTSKEQVTLSIDVDVVSIFRATGRGWQTRMNAALREWLGPPWAL